MAVRLLARGPRVRALRQPREGARANAVRGRIGAPERASCRPARRVCPAPPAKAPLRRIAAAAATSASARSSAVCAFWEGECPGVRPSHLREDLRARQPRRPLVIPSLPTSLALRSREPITRRRGRVRSLWWTLGGRFPPRRCASRPPRMSLGSHKRCLGVRGGQRCRGGVCRRRGGCAAVHELADRPEISRVSSHMGTWPQPGSTRHSTPGISRRRRGA